MRNPIRLWLIARAIRRIIAAYRIGRAQGAVERRLKTAHEVSPSWIEALNADLSRAIVREVFYGASPPKPKPKREPGRQRIAMPSDGMSIFGGSSWRGPIPKGARKGRWEDHHTFPDRKPSRDYFGLHGDPPISFVCPACELEQPPVHAERTCPYCGLHLRALGSFLFWWRDEPATVPACLSALHPQIPVLVFPSSGQMSLS
jgi:hypothetical protein